jgi:hypothetical protein
MPSDQREEDSLALSFTSPPLAEPVEILGFPEVELTLSSDRPNALVAVRLCDVFPDGTSALVTRGLLNLTHRDSHERPTPVEPGQPYSVSLRLNAIAYSMLAGHRWRVSISPNYWPWAWPSPAPVTLTVYTGDRLSRLTLPVRPPRPEDADLPAFEPPEGAEPLRADMLRPASRRRLVKHDVVVNQYQIEDFNDMGRRRLHSNGLEYESTRTDTYTINEGDPLSAQVHCRREIVIERGDWRTRVHTSSVLTSDADRFVVTNALETFEGDQLVFGKTWEFRVSRDGV